MQPTLCARCKKNVAVIFITKIENGVSTNEGLCLKCAKELNIKPEDASRLANELARYQVDRFKEQNRKRFEDNKKMHDAALQKYSKADFETINAGIDACFAPDGVMTRAMFVTVLASQHDFNRDDYKTSSFTDVPAGKWYSVNVEWAYKEGLVAGMGNKTFAPDTVINRAQLVTLIRTYAEYLGYDFVDSRDWVQFSYDGKVDFEKLFEGKAVKHITTAGTDSILELAENRKDFKMGDHDFNKFYKYHFKFCFYFDRYSYKWNTSSF